MVLIKTIEIQRGSSLKSTFEYEVKSTIEDGYKLIEQNEDYAKLQKTVGDSMTIEEFKKYKNK